MFNPLNNRLVNQDQPPGESPQTQPNRGSTGGPTQQTPASTSSATPYVHIHGSSAQYTQQQLMEQVANKRESVVIQIDDDGSIPYAVNQFRLWSQTNPQGTAAFPAHLRKFIEECRGQKCLFSPEHEQVIIADKLGSEVTKAVKVVNVLPSTDGGNRHSPATAIHYPFVAIINPATGQEETHRAGYMDPHHWEQVDNGCFKLKQAASPSAAIKAAFRGPTRLDCLPATELILAQALLATLGDDLFDQAFAWKSHNDPGIVFGHCPDLLENRIEGFRNDIEGISHLSQLKNGDWTYYGNDPRYRKKHPTGALRGQNVIWTDNNQFEGLGMRPMSLSEMKSMMEDAFNMPPNRLDEADSRHEAELADATDPEVEGWRSSLVIRLNAVMVRELMPW